MFVCAVGLGGARMRCCFCGGKACEGERADSVLLHWRCVSCDSEARTEFVDGVPLECYDDRTWNPRWTTVRTCPSGSLFVAPKREEPG